MEQTSLGPLSVSSMALGAMLFGTSTEEAMSLRLLYGFVAGGGNFIDTSNNYAFWPANGRSGASEASVSPSANTSSATRRCSLRLGPRNSPLSSSCPRISQG